MTVFLFSLAGIPPLGGWFAKFVGVPGAAVGRHAAGRTRWPSSVGVNSVIALYYYANVAREMWMEPAPDGDVTPIRVPPSLGAALVHHRVGHDRAVGVLPGPRRSASATSARSSSPDR